MLKEGHSQYMDILLYLCLGCLLTVSSLREVFISPTTALSGVVEVLCSPISHPLKSQISFKLAQGQYIEPTRRRYSTSANAAESA